MGSTVGLFVGQTVLPELLQPLLQHPLLLDGSLPLLFSLSLNGSFESLLLQLDLCPELSQTSLLGFNLQARAVQRGLIWVHSCVLFKHDQQLQLEESRISDTVTALGSETGLHSYRLHGILKTPAHLKS